MVDEPDFITENQMGKWVSDFDCWEVCDQICQNLFTYTKFAYKKAIEVVQKIQMTNSISARRILKDTNKGIDR